MATIVSTRILALRALSPRYLGSGTLLDQAGVVVALSRDSATVPASADGVVSSFVTAETVITVKRANITDTDNWTIIKSDGSGVASTLSGSTLAVTALSTDVGTVTLTISRSGYTSITKVFSVSKAKAGTSGTSGTRGSARRYIVGSPWTDSAANTAVGGTPMTGDEVTMSNGIDYTMVKVYNGSSWQHPGTVIDGSLIVTNTITSTKIDSRNLSIKDASGSVILSAGTPLSYSNINPAPGWLNSAISLSTLGAGSFATLSQINAANISTYIASAAIGEAYIGTISANKINTNGLSIRNPSGTVILNADSTGTYSGTLKVGSGTTPGGAAFESNSGNTCFAAYLVGGVASFNNNYLATHSVSATCFDTNYHAVKGTSDVSTAIRGTGNGGGTYDSKTHGIRGEHLGGSSGNTSGLVGAANGYDFYADGAGANYGAFTGAHDCLLPLNSTTQIGDIVVDIACKARRGYSNTLFEVAASSAPYQKGVVGMLILVNGLLKNQTLPAVFNSPVITIDDFGNEVTATDAEYAAVCETHNCAVMNAIGEGQINVCGEGGNIEAGDLIVTSSIPGKGMRQSDDLVRNVTVAKARESVQFGSLTEVKTIACIYMCG